MKSKNRIVTLLVAFTFVFATFFIPKNVYATTYKGADVYEYDNISNYQQLKNDGVSIIIQKATEGLYHNDSLLNYRYNAITQNGFKIGYYHFADNTGNPVGEAQHFLSKVQGLHSDTVLWLDIENEGNWSKSQAISYTNQFINYVQARGYKIGVYTGLSFYYEYLQGNIPNVPIWLASYGSQPKQFPNTVSWQYSESGQLSGVIGDIDLDYFNDSIFTGQAPVGANNATAQSSVVRSNQVAVLQSNLNHLLQWSLVTDGINGTQTTMATKTFQKMCGLTQDGVVGTKTNSAINSILNKPVLKYGSYGTSTRYLQYRLGITADGAFGSNTRQVIINYQRSHGLKADGIVGNQTWKALLGL